MLNDFERCLRALRSRDPRFDGWFVAAITSTGIYCRPSCPAPTAKREHVRFHATAAAAQAAGFRACKRCRPDAAPGSPEWDLRADLTGRAMRLIADGVVDREGVRGLALRLGYSERHVTRQLTQEVGAGPLALARAQRARSARTLIESTDLPFTDVAYAAGFASVRQFNDVIRSVFDKTPTELRRAANRGEHARGVADDGLRLRLPYRVPCDVDGVLAFLTTRAVPGVETAADGRYQRSLRLPHGDAVAELWPGDGYVNCMLHLDDLRDLTSAVQRCRRLLDLDADSTAVTASLEADPLLAEVVRRSPGRRVPGTADGTELAARAVLGQQVSVAAARTLSGRLVAAAGKPLRRPRGDITHTFPSADVIAELEDAVLAIPAARRHTLRCLAQHLATGDIAIDAGVDRDGLVHDLQAIAGIGPWTADYIRMRGTGDPDVFLATDLGVRRAVQRLIPDAGAEQLDGRSKRWRPWRSYAVMHLWNLPELDAKDVA